MTVNPGFWGQSFIKGVLEKVHELVEIRDEASMNYLIEVDGGVGSEHVISCLEAGVDVFVAGTAYYKKDEEERNNSQS